MFGGRTDLPEPLEVTKQYIDPFHSYVFNIPYILILLDFLPNVKAATLIFISVCGWAISSAKEGKSGLTYNLVKS